MTERDMAPDERLRRDQDAPDEPVTGADAPSQPEAGSEAEALGDTGALADFGEEELLYRTVRPDEQIRSEIVWLLSGNELVDGKQLEVDVRDGVVSLRGTVVHPEAVRVIGERVALIAGVRSVDNHLRPRSPSR